jgi:hypothetical protein
MQMVIAALLVIFFSVPQQPTTNKSAKSDQSNISKQEGGEQPDKAVPAQPCPQSATTNQKKDESANDSKDWIYRTYLISGPIVGIIAFATAFLVWRQIHTLKAVERAWLVVTTEPPRTLSKGKGGWIYQGYGFEWYVKNCGKTPAFIIQIGARIHSVKTISDLPAEPVIEDYEIFPDGGMSIGPSEIIPRFTMAAPQDKQPLTTQDWEDFRVGKIKWVAYGVIKYRLTILREIRETRFCYIATPNRPERFSRSAIPKNYTKQT